MAKTCIIETRMKVYNRDGWTCQKCGKTDNLTMAHRIAKYNTAWVKKTSWHKYNIIVNSIEAGQILNDPLNLVTACAGACNDWYNIGFKKVEAEELLKTILIKREYLK